MVWPFRTRPISIRPPDWSSPRQAALDEPFLLMNRSGLALSHRDMLTSMFLIGATGSGKTGVLHHVVAAAMRSGYSLLLLTVKPSDTRDYLGLARLCGRADVTVFRPETHSFNPVRALIGSMGDSPAMVERVVALIMDAVTRLHDGSSGDARFWQSLSEKAVAHLVTLAVLAGVTPSFRWILDALRDRARSPEEAADPAWQTTNPVCQAIARALGAPMTASQRADLDQAARWWFADLPRMPVRTVESVIITLSGPLSKLVRGPLGEVLNSNESSWDPASLCHRPGIAIIDASVQEHGPLGLSLQRMIKRVFFEQLKTRDLRTGAWPILIVQDEAQDLLDTEVDADLIRTMRSRRVATVLATQTINNLVEACRDAREAKMYAEAVAALPGIKVMLANTCPESLHWCERALTSVPTVKLSSGTSDRSDTDPSSSGRSSNRSQNFAIEHAPAVMAHEIATLRTGGPPNNMIVEAILSRVGAPFPTGRPHARVAFRQIDLP